MPHDSRQQLLSPGDYIIFKPLNGAKLSVGRIINISLSEICSGQALYVADFEGMRSDYFDAKDSVLVLKSDGQLPIIGPVVEPL